MKQANIRRLERKDIDFAYKMTAIEQWNVTRSDVARMLDFEPKGCFIAETNGKPAGHVFSIAYGMVGWIGLLIVEPNHRRRGLGTVLMKEAIEYLLDKKVETTKLDAVPEIADLYRNFGFVDECESLRFMGTNQYSPLSEDIAIEPVKQEKVPEIAEFDEKYFGADRTRVLSRLFEENPGLSFVSCKGSDIIGYITCRKAERGYNLGPWTCDPKNPLHAEALLKACLNKFELGSEIYVGLPSPNVSAVDILTNHDFRQYSKSIRMRLGKKPEIEDPHGVFAIAGAMKG